MRDTCDTTKNISVLSVSPWRIPPWLRGGNGWGRGHEAGEDFAAEPRRRTRVTRQKTSPCSPCLRGEFLRGSTAATAGGVATKPGRISPRSRGEDADCSWSFQRLGHAGHV